MMRARIEHGSSRTIHCHAGDSCQTVAIEFDSHIWAASLLPPTLFKMVLLNVGQHDTSSEVDVAPQPHDGRPNFKPVMERHDGVVRPLRDSRMWVAVVCRAWRRFMCDDAMWAGALSLCSIWLLMLELYHVAGFNK